MNTRILFSLLIALCFFSSDSWAQQEPESDSVNHADLIQATLRSAGENVSQLEEALAQIDPDMKPGLEYLLAYLPPSDAKSLSADFLLEHVQGAYKAWRESPWKARVSKETFLNYMLPFANVSERRERWRSDFRDRFLPLVDSANTPSEAAVILNQKIFAELGVKYSTKRKRADQGPYESIEGGTASCTGLSILLIDACRSVGVPARFVGTPRWSDNSGNHSWVEIWDGEWKFTGAAEPTGDDLNRGWFTERASKAVSQEPQYAIYAVTYKNTGLKFPMVWQRNADPVWAVNVTDRYVARESALKDGQVLTRFKIVDESTGERIVANLEVSDLEGKVLFHGQSKDERFDSNDHVEVALPEATPLVARYRVGDRPASETRFDTGSKTSLVVLEVDSSSLKSVREKALSKQEAKDLAAALYDAHRKEVAELWQAAMESKIVRLKKYPGLEMKYDFKVFGEKPAEGHALYISMHGGGNAPTRLNDQQWKNQLRLYEPKEGIYLAPRAPTDSWNLWHQSHIDAFFDRIIAGFVASGQVDPDRVYLMGYSAGGDGVYQLAPRMADRFAAASMMAGHPNETRPLGLRNLPFAIFMGGKDAAYDRNKIAEQWKEKLAEFKASDPEGYDHKVVIYPEKGHWMDREDASVLPWLAERTRNPWPKKIVWHQDDVTHDRFYWLGVPEGKAKERTTVVASVQGQTVTVDSDDVSEVRLWLSDQLVDLDEELQVVFNGKLTHLKVNRTESSTQASLDSRFDKSMVASAYVDIVKDD